MSDKPNKVKDFISSVVGGVTSGGVSGAVDLMSNGGDLIDRFFETKDEKREALMEIAKAQIAQNTQEAKHSSIWVAGWRPFIGWVLGLGLFFYYPIRFAVATYLWAREVLESGLLVDYPIDAADMIQMVLAMLGMAGLRSYEKKQKITK